jgi:hypothetical protein
MVRNKRTARPGTRERFERPKIVIGRMGKNLFAAYDAEGYYIKDGMILTSKSGPEQLLYLLGLINSRLLDFYYRNYFVTIDILKNAVLQLPFPNASPTQRTDLIGLVKRLTELYEKLEDLRGKQTDESLGLRRKILENERKIDDLVYDMYGLTAEERPIVDRDAPQGLAAS